MKIKLASILCFVLPMAANLAAVRAEEQSQDPSAAQPQVVSLVGTWATCEGGMCESFRTYNTFKADGTYSIESACQYYYLLEEGTYTYVNGLLTTFSKTYTYTGWASWTMPSDGEPVKAVVTWIDDDHVQLQGLVLSRQVPKAE